MKLNIKSILLGTAACLALSSCSSFLDDKPYSDLTNDNWGSGGKDKATEYTTAKQMEQLLTGTYNDFGLEFWQLDIYMINDSQSDNAYAGEDKEPTRQIDELRMATSNNIVNRDWGYLYKQIAKANTIIAWIPKIKDTELTEARRNEIDGEARAIRALCYFHLVRIYGHVPLIVDYIPEISIGNIAEIYPLLYPAQDSKEVVYAQIIDDLVYAETNVSNYSAFKFKITKAVVNLLLAEVYATKDEVAGADWAKVKEYASTVVSNSNYGLLDSYDGLFAVAGGAQNGILPSTNLINEHSKESLLEVDYTSSATLGNWGASMFYGVDWKKFNTPSQDLNRAFLNANDHVRRNASIMFGDVTGKWTDKYWASNNYPYCYKMRSKEAGNVILYRYAEAVLLLADAENELGNIEEAKKQLNKIRTRVGLNNTTANSKEDMREAIEKEHRLEFAFEGKRWMDLKRRGRFVHAMRVVGDHQATYASRITENTLIWPIPQNEMELNDKLVQNPGY